MTEQSSTPLQRKRLALAAIGIAAVAAAVPVLWFAAILAVGLMSVLASGRLRWTVIGVGGALVIVSCVRFALEQAKPNLQAETSEIEKTALSHLREIYWAESQARQIKLVDADHDGAGEYLSFPELLGEQTKRFSTQSPSLLKSDVFRVVDAEHGLYESERYYFMIYLPGADGLPTTQGDAVDPAAASRSFAAYAWPVDSTRGQHKAFYVDHFEQICESDQFAGPSSPPKPSAYALQAREGVSVCGQDEDTGVWRTWKGRSGRAKEPRATR